MKETLLSFIQGLPQFVLGILSTGVLVKWLEWRKEKKQKNQDSFLELEISKHQTQADRETSAQDRLNKIIDEQLADLRALRSQKEQMASENLTLQHRVFLLEHENGLKDKQIESLKQRIDLIENA